MVSQYTRQRTSKPDYGLIEDVLLPWYYTLMQQYANRPFGGWSGNETMNSLYEQMMLEYGQERYKP